MNDGTGSVILIDVKTRTDNSSRLRSSVFDLVRSQNGLRGIVDDLTRVLGLPVDVLLLGESGTGKELIARALHEADPVKHAHRFVAVNYATLAENLLEADLFSYLRGAFTGATDDREGLFQQAHGGTLFLDEIGELPLRLQPKLLRALQERAVPPWAGATKCPSTCASCRRQTVTLAPPLRATASGATSTFASPTSSFASRLCGSGAAISRNWPIISWTSTAGNSFAPTSTPSAKAPKPGCAVATGGPTTCGS